jgi:hypothetical protein
LASLFTAFAVATGGSARAVAIAFDGVGGAVDIVGLSVTIVILAVTHFGCGLRRLLADAVCALALVDSGLADTFSGAIKAAFTDESDVVDLAIAIFV